MKLIIRVTDLLLYTSIFTACCAVSLCMATEKLINGVSPPVINLLHILVFGSTLLVYNTPRITVAGRKHRGRYFFFFLAGLVLTAIGLYGQSLVMLVVSGSLGVFAFSYFLPVLPFEHKKRLRDFGGVKILVLAGVWTIATSVLPMLYWQKSITAYPFEIVLRSVFIFTLCVAFDIRDVRADHSNNINTLPNKVGLENSYRLIYATLTLFAGLSVMQYLRYPDEPRLAGALITTVVSWVVLSYLRNRSSDRAYLLLADGLMLFYAVLVQIS